MKIRGLRGGEQINMQRISQKALTWLMLALGHARAEDFLEQQSWGATLPATVYLYTATVVTVT